MSDMDALKEALRDWRHSLFRLEALAQYTVDFEQAEFAAFLRGDPLPPTPPDLEDWLAQLRQERTEGKTRTRVHAVAGPLTPYLQYEIGWGYTVNAAAGEDIHMLHVPSWAQSPFGEQPPDFYLLDDERVVLMDYDQLGRWQGGEIIREPAQVADYRRLRDLAMGSAVTFARYLAALRRLPISPISLVPAEEALSA